MSPMDSLIEAAENGYCLSLGIARVKDKMQYDLVLVMPQGSPVTAADTMEQVADWLQGQIITQFPESDYAKRLVREKALVEKLTKPQH